MSADQPSSLGPGAWATGSQSELTPSESMGTSEAVRHTHTHAQRPPHITLFIHAPLNHCRALHTQLPVHDCCYKRLYFFKVIFSSLFVRPTLVFLSRPPPLSLSISTVSLFPVHPPSVSFELNLSDFTGLWPPSPCYLSLSPSLLLSPSLPPSLSPHQTCVLCSAAHRPLGLC